jgi:hypothetical protein
MYIVFNYTSKLFREKDNRFFSQKAWGEGSSGI